jgi:hypothetical protein
LGQFRELWKKMIWKVGFRGLVSLPWQHTCTLFFVSVWISGQEIKWLFFHTLPTYQICIMCLVFPNSRWLYRERNLIIWTQSKQNCGMHLANFKQYISWNASNTGITGLTV